MIHHIPAQRLEQPYELVKIHPYSNAEDPLWYKRAVLYEVHVRAFCDTNRDGKGDFQGLAEKIPYLKKLGVTCLWILPFFDSPLKDDGYDVRDYRKVHPDFGDLEDFKWFLKVAHESGLRVIIELIMNHTSDQHFWFQQSRLGKGNPYSDYYVWSDTDTRYSGTRIIFIDTEKSNWTFDPVRKQYFWHRFYSHQPDLNYDNPKVEEEMMDVARFWLKIGIDGFRADAVPYLYEREGTSNENLPETHQFFKRLRRMMDAEFPGTVLLSEANQLPIDAVEYFGRGDEFDMSFHFPVMPRLFMALRKETRFPIVEVMKETPDIPSACQWVVFLRNHDELTLEMVSEEEREYMWGEYAKDARMRCNLGIRRRLFPLVENSRLEAELLNALLFSLPGTPVIYYGDEIGMGDNVFLGDRFHH
ncbi:maltose alpha-D-glucosyltransferase [Monocercomonoides exilis]|uniref:maltose alpha-D-glucosyltransferase n=1 Tax=Monocercomonoides exilis TaxID=2049356 RepID=UPI00355A9B24|nr:maltose alpha-D-glucosyltransferase [Monocercomonoides exilis]|eukprot:MONOS_7954.1-p1 / transcript=MONOS_7954.1 / gene=MONOS_7954 / organism=Monocercomonoides_exilis_PA203 / gene_product=maltose alpha-D-glucosyltransferase / transcript_product=maltose alpha-D-glucosyltransferase / location=Mono_scaffold00287:18377-20630(-) / protein_length=416 / sequence_SO=supercontig / SO=protein_coding / is_pseudo=false